MIKTALMALCCALVPLWTLGQHTVEHAAPPLADPQASVSLLLVDMATGEALDEYRPDTRLCPASVWKLATTGAALKLLGPDFRFRTVLAADGQIADGVLHGDLYIVGGGDPALGSRFFGEGADAVLSQWVAAVRDAGIDSISGNIVANAACFRGVRIPRTRIWEDMANYYGTGASGLNFSDNTYYIDFDVPDLPGDTARISKVHPEVPGLDIKSCVVAGTVRSDQAFVFGSPLDTRRVVRGTLPAGSGRYTIKGSLPDPALFAAFHLRRRLVDAGVGVRGGFRAERDIVHEPATLRVLDTHRSPTLDRLVRHTNAHSDNLFAETFLLQLGARAGDPTTAGGLDALNAFYDPICRTDYPFFAYDGSGLSRFTAVSARQVTQMLLMAHDDLALGHSLLDALPLAGREGTLKWFAARSNLAGNLRAKSGSMEGVRAYAGFFTAFSGRELAFAVLVNNYQGSGNDVRKAIEGYLLKVYGDY